MQSRMKTIVILADGMADRPMARLGGRTPLMAARTPHIDRLCAMARTGRLMTIPEDLPAGSEVANLSVLGYDVKKVYQGRGVLEAASLGVCLERSDLAMRCNLICIENEKIKNHSAGHIPSDQAKPLIEELNRKFGSDRIHFANGKSYRHLLVLKGGSDRIECTPPHDVPGTPFRDMMVRALDPRGKGTAALLNDLILRSRDILDNHPVNRERRSQGKDPANAIWPWSPGRKPKMKTFQDLYGITGAVISAVDLIHGIGVYAGMTSIPVQGATGLADTNYEGKTEAAIRALKDKDFVFLHIEASDEAGHEGDVDLKIRTIESLDQRVVKFIMEETRKMAEPVAVALLPDHPTPCEVRTHVRDAVPFLIYKPGVESDGVTEFNETSVEKGAYGLLKGDQFIRELLGRK